MTRAAETHRAGGHPSGALTLARVSSRQSHALAAAAALLVLLLGIAAGAPKLSMPGVDNDSTLRMVEVRDLLAGQGWFDLVQYRMGPAGGIEMHWSRLVDAPLALLVVAGEAITGSRASGELFARLTWPTLLLALTLGFMASVAHRIGGRPAVLPTIVSGAIALHTTGIFGPGAIDHHNLQITLVMGALALLLAGSLPAAFIAGLAAGASLAVGMETAPYVAALGGTTAVFWLARGTVERDRATGFATGFAFGGMFLLAALVAPQRWLTPACDAFSIVQASSAALAGAGLALAVLLASGRGPLARAACLVVLAAGLVLFLMLLYPQCLASPYADVPARLHQFWLDGVSEAQSLPDFLRHETASALGNYSVPGLGLVVVAAWALRGQATLAAALCGAMLAAAVGVAIWQVRGLPFALAFAAPILGAWVGTLRERQSERLGFPRLALAWLASINVVWVMATTGAASLLPGQDGRPPVPAHAEICNAAAAFSSLALEAPTTVLAVSNHGSSILALTSHRVLAGPYHRNVEGNLAAIDALTGSPEAAREIVERHRVGIVAFCPGNPEAAMMAERAPAGLAASLAAGSPPPWLARLPGDGPLQLYKVR